MPILPLWDAPGDFRHHIHLIGGRTVVDPMRCFILWQMSAYAQHLNGDYAELGVYKGGTAKIILKHVPKGRKLHLFDTFDGIPEASPGMDTHKVGDFSDVSIDEVKGFLGEDSRLRYHEGVFPNTAKGPLKHSKFSMVHVDADVYPAVKAACEFFWPRMAKSGVIVFDDYGFSQCAGARKAVDEYFHDRYTQPVYLPTGQAIVIRT